MDCCLYKTKTSNHIKSATDVRITAWFTVICLTDVLSLLAMEQFSLLFSLALEVYLNC